MDSKAFYDNFITYQIKTGINDRIYHLYKKLYKTGLSAQSAVLEIGCGIGSLTYLISRRVTKGPVISVDISPKSIEYAKKNINRGNIKFHATDISAFEPEIEYFDRILLFDVLEHIPEQDHVRLFEKISRWMNDQSLLLINLPNAAYIQYCRKHNAGALQETDQPIFIDHLAAALAGASLDIESFETYGIWAKNDYHFLKVKRRKEFEVQLLSNERSFFEKVKYRLSREIRKLVYRYPVKPG